MISPLRILYLEDDPKDAELVQATLETEGVACHLTRVESEPEFSASLHQGGFDLVLADYTLPAFDGLSALKITRKIRPEMPFIFVSGTMGEEVAIEALKMEATDYVLKTRLSRILPSVRRALREAEEKTERRRAEEALRASERNFRLIVDSIPAFICTLAPTGQIELVNPQLLEYLGKTLEELRAWPTNDTVHPDDLPRVIAAWKRSWDSGHPFDDEHRLRRADGVYRWFRVRARPLRDADGRIIRWYDLFTDVDDGKKAEQQLRHSEAYLAEAQKLSHTGSFGWDVASGNIYWTDETFRIFEFPPTIPPTVARVMERVHPDDAPFVRQRLDAASRERRAFDLEHRLLMPDGLIKYIRAVGHPAKEDQRGNLEFVGLVTDITERKRSEEEMRKLSSLVENSTDLIAIGSLQGEVLFINAAGQAIVGLSGNEEVRGTRIPDYVAEQDFERFNAEVLPSLFRDGRWEGETLFKHFKSGAAIPMWQHVFFITDEGSGRRLAIATISRDIAERKRAEEVSRMAQADLARVNRVMLVGEMTASIAHEVNQPLAGVIAHAGTCLRWLDMQPPDMEEARQALGFIVKDGNRAGRGHPPHSHPR